MNRTIGTCSNCGGRVVVPTVWMSVVPPVPHCEKCGSSAAQPHGGVIEMEPKKPELPGPLLPRVGR